MSPAQRHEPRSTHRHPHRHCTTERRRSSRAASSAFRTTHFEVNEYVAAGWTTEQFNQFDLVHSNAMGRNTEANVALDLGLPGYATYLNEVLETQLNLYMVEDNITVDELATRVTAGWAQTHVDNGGVESQLRIYRRTLGLNDIITCPDGQFFSASIGACVRTITVGLGNATFVPCSVTGCGRFASCADNGANTPCTCSSADTQPASDFATSRACVPAVASTGQQRVFWTLSMFAFGCGFVLCLFVMNGELHQRTLTHCTPIPLPSAHPSVAPQACKLTSSRLHIVVTQSLCATLSSPSAADKASGRLEPSLFLTLFSRQRTKAKRRPNERKRTHLPSATLVL